MNVAIVHSEALQLPATSMYMHCNTESSGTNCIEGHSEPDVAVVVDFKATLINACEGFETDEVYQTVHTKSAETMAQLERESKMYMH
jgi:hypothetical protein